MKKIFVHLIFKDTAILGIREKHCNRYTLERRAETVDTPYGQICKKIRSGYGVSRSKYEYEDLARVAEANDLNITPIMNDVP